MPGYFSVERYAQGLLSLLRPCYGLREDAKGAVAHASATWISINFLCVGSKRRRKVTQQLLVTYGLTHRNHDFESYVAAAHSTIFSTAPKLEKNAPVIGQKLT